MISRTIIRHAILGLLVVHVGTPLAGAESVLAPESFKHYVDAFNAYDEDLYTNAISNADAWSFMKGNIPLLDCPDKDIEGTYYFRWWTYRKHIRKTPDGYVVTELLPKVSWSRKHNTINCPAGHHFYEGRWLHDQTILNDYAVFWFRKGGAPRQYSFWAADAYYAMYCVHNDRAFVVDLLDDLVKNYEAWEEERQLRDGLFWQYGDRDGMECSIGKDGKRATINSYMYGDARAIAAIARLANRPDLAWEYEAKADQLRRLVQDKLWNPEARFFKTLKRSPYELVMPQSSSDKMVPRYTWLMGKNQGTLQWVQYDFKNPLRVDAAEVYWFIEEAVVDLPQSWRVLYREGEEWKPVENPEVDPPARDKFVSTRFKSVETSALRLEAQLQPRKSAGILEWRVLSDGKNVAPGAKAERSVPRSGRWGNTVRALNDGENPSREAAQVDVRELHGYTPWYFNLPESGKGYEAAWKQLMDPKGFYAPFGPTTAEQRHPEFKIAYTGHGCQWNGPSWPLATAVTLTALANVLNNYQQDAISKTDYFETLSIYAKSHRRKREDGRVVPWIDENLNPFTGEWIARRRCEEQNAVLKERGQESRILRERGKDYNHSSYCDLIITGVVGLRPRADDVVEVNPLVPDGVWDYFCLDNISYHGRIITILWDKTGKKYGKGEGLRVFADGREIVSSNGLGRVSGRLMP